MQERSGIDIAAALVSADVDIGISSALDGIIENVVTHLVDEAFELPRFGVLRRRGTTNDNILAFAELLKNTLQTLRHAAVAPAAFRVGPGSSREKTLMTTKTRVWSGRAIGFVLASAADPR